MVMEEYVCSIRRQVLFVTLVLLAVLGNEPHRTVHAQVGTTKLHSATTLGLAVHAGGRTTILPVRTTQHRATTQAAGQPYATTNAATGATRRGTGGVNTGAATASVSRNTPRAGGATQAPGGGATAGPASRGAIASTQKAVIASSWRTAGPAGGTTQAAGTTRGYTLSTASPSSICGFNIEYLFNILSPLKDNEDACVSEATKDLASTFGVSSSRVVDVTCTDTIKDTIKVTAMITPGSKPTSQDLVNFKARSDYTTVRFNGWQNRIGEIVRESFQYGNVACALPSEKSYLLGLSDTHWIMIGMGTVILLLFIVSITIICVGRRGGKGSRERMDEEASATSEANSEDDEQPKKKWYSFLQRGKKGDDDSDGNRTDDESAYESAKGDGGSESDQESDKIHDDHKVL